MPRHLRLTGTVSPLYKVKQNIYGVINIIIVPKDDAVSKRRSCI